MADYYIRTSDVEIKQMLKRLADLDKRSISMEIAWIVRKEYEKRFGNGKLVDIAQNKDKAKS